MFKKGSTGQFVKIIQRILGLTPVDGVFGKQTAQAVKEFQRANGLAPDGIVGFNTLSIMSMVSFATNIDDLHFSLTTQKIQAANMEDIPKLATAILPLFKKTDYVRQHIEEGLEMGLNYRNELHINSPEDLAHFFGQMREEVGRGFVVQENLNYSCEALPKLFKYYKNNPNEAKEHGRCNGHAANQEAIANHAYANRIGNGDINSGDGWKYKGRGSKQLTGRANYQRFQDYMDDYFPNLTNDFMQNPELLEQPGYALLSGAIFWEQNKLYKAARKGINKKASYAVTKIINKYTHSYENRWEHTQKAAKLLGII